MTKYIARYNDQIVGKRSTKDRTYTHAIVIIREGAAPAVATWCGRPDLAQSEQRRRTGPTQTAVIVPAEIAPSAARTAQAFNDAVAGTAFGRTVKFVGID